MVTEQTEFDCLVWISKELLRVDEVCAVLRLGKDSVYALIDEGALEAHQGEKDRSHIKIRRRSVVAYLATTARYEPADFAETLFKLARRLAPAQRADLLKKLTALS